MSRPENTKTQPSLQLPTLGRLEFGGISTESLYIEAGLDLRVGLYLAADISDGVEQLCDRLGDAINNGEVAYLAEVRALGLLSSMSSALSRGAWFALRGEDEE
ncbi:hypothetical protein [Pseudomonas typographi]|uniref:Uncharacterized protein n=1 Tax=Pseudomonas typographi TaxID=2715964 RepID=A0ABR7Z6Y1_9PSED|nr:hypothetical protein [Pseudomonas typographi]MBD1601157.1 hypothetical protein [Pseudomonas typographi]